jgi:hypothetical protein
MNDTYHFWQRRETFRLQVRRQRALHLIIAEAFIDHRHPHTIASLATSTNLHQHRLAVTPFHLAMGRAVTDTQGGDDPLLVLDESTHTTYRDRTPSVSQLIQPERERQ